MSLVKTISQLDISASLTGTEPFVHGSGDTATANVIRKFILQSYGVFNVKDFGAVCDGITDDSTAVQATITAATTAGYARIKFPAGVCLFNSGVTNNGSNIAFDGEGIGISILKVGYSNTGLTSGMLVLRDTGGVPVKNITISNLSINQNSNPTNGVTIRGGSNVVPHTNIRFENVEWYGRGVDNTGSTGCLLIHADYGALTGTVRDVILTGCIFRDGVATNSSNKTAKSITILSDSGLNNFQVKDTIFKNTYGDTISINSNDVRGLSNFLFDNVYFENTVQLEYGVTLADIFDNNRRGIDGVTIINCRWDHSGIGWTRTQDVYAWALYNCYRFKVDSCSFYYVSRVGAPGHSSPSGNENFAWTFSNNVVQEAIQFTDADGHRAGVYSGNVFYRVWEGPIIGTYGNHYPTLWTGNLFYNCLHTTPTSQQYFQALALLEDGGTVIEGNTIYDDLGAASLLKWGFYELSGGGSTTYPNVYKNNTFLGGGTGGAGPTVATFALDTGFKHVIKGNTGLTEGTINSYVINGVYQSGSTSPLAATDIATDNWKSTGIQVAENRTPTINFLAKAANYTVTARDSVLTGDCTSGSLTFTLPTAIGISGTELTFKRVDASGNNVIIDGNGTETIDGATTKTITTQWGFITIVSNGTNWVIIASGGTIT